jgi:hypothetical protein
LKSSRVPARRHHHVIAGAEGMRTMVDRVSELRNTWVACYDGGLTGVERR